MCGAHGSRRRIVPLPDIRQAQSSPLFHFTGKPRADKPREFEGRALNIFGSRQRTVPLGCNKKKVKKPGCLIGVKTHSRRQQ
jgi:hypothetical protein